MNAQSGLISWTPAAGQTGPQAVTVNVIDGKGGSDSQIFNVTVAAAGQIIVPDLHNLNRVAAEIAIQQSQLNLGTTSFEHSGSVTEGIVLQQSPLPGGQVNLGTPVNLLVSLGPDIGLPPSPATVAPAIDQTVATTMADSTNFLYSGPNAIQTLANGQPLAEGTIEPLRADVIRGKVTSSDGHPLPGVTIAVLNHPELGQTLSRADGRYDLAVNGGGTLTVDFQKTGYLPVQRSVNTPWQDFVVIADVILLARDPTVTVVDFTAPAAMQAVLGSEVTDASGTRRPALLIPHGTATEVYNPDGSTRPVTSLNLRFTEYTVGPNGPAAMPAPLPPTSAYTYAVELGADEATSKIAGKDVMFSQPVYFYLENFLGFPTGIQVPAAYYDRDKAAWIPVPDGRIIKILSITGGLANLDTDGDGQADDGAALGVTEAERQQLASLYTTGQSLERIPVDHFSTYDPNYGYGPEPGSDPPKQPRPENKDKHKEDNPCKSKGSVIDCENQILGESIGLVGIPYNLNYRSDRVHGRRTASSLDIALTGATVPAPLKSIELEVRVAGQVITKSFTPSANLHYSFTWDGRDVYGRQVMGTQPVGIRIGYVYTTFYNLPPAMARSFGLSSGQPIPGKIPTRIPMELWQEQTAQVSQWDARPQGFGSWTLDVHHAYDPDGKVLYLGTGERRSALGLRVNTMNIVAGQAGTPGFGGDGKPAKLEGVLAYPSSVAVGFDGSLYISDMGNRLIRRVDADGIITTVAGSGNYGYDGDNRPATEASLAPLDVAVAADGSMYIADGSNNRIRRVDSHGFITTVAGNGSNGFSGDGGLAVNARLSYPQGVAVGPEGSLYIAEGGARIRRVGPDGRISTVAGNDEIGSSPDGIPAILAKLNNPVDVIVDRDGSLYIAEQNNHRIRRVGPDGIITTAAGDGTTLFGGDGGPATQAGLNSPNSVAVGPDGSLYVSDLFHDRIRRVGPDGIIITVAGNGVRGYDGDGGPAAQTGLNGPRGLAVAPSGEIYLADQWNSLVRRVAAPLPGFATGDLAVASDDGDEIYHFNGIGRHLRTLNALTGATLFTFAYDTGGRLAKVTDGDGLATTIERNALGAPTAIIGPYGQRTTLALNANGYLSRGTNPAGEAVKFDYTADGLLTRYTDPNGHASNLAYDGLGRLLSDQDAEGGSQTLARTELGAGYQVTLTTALNRTTSHLVEPLTTGGLRRVNTFPDGITAETVTGSDGSTRTTLADGSVSNLLETGDPRFGMQSPVIKSLSEATDGLALNSGTTRAVVLARPDDPLSFRTLTDTETVNGRVSTTVYDAASGTSTQTSPASRITHIVSDRLGRITQAQVAGILPVNTSYDAQGRPASIVRGSGADTRQSTFSYNPQGYLASMTDPLGRVFGYEYDAAGRIIRQTLPDGREIGYGYDANSNLTSITPSGRPAHLLAYTEVNLLKEYFPPNVAGTGSTQYAYDHDRNRVQQTLPDGTTLNYGYNGKEQLEKLSIVSGTSATEDYGYAYDPDTGRLAGVTAPDGGALNFTYSGSLLTLTEWTGTVAGQVNWTYDNDFRITEIKLNGADPIALKYDADSLLTQAGDLVLTRRSDNGLLAGTTLGKVSDSLSYNDFGEATGYTATIDGTAAFTVQYVRDKLGRIIQMTETAGGTTNTYNYGYNLSGRLVQVKQNGDVTASYTYDANGNRLTGPGVVTPASYDDQDRLLFYGNATYTYTANGDLKTKAVGGASTRYGYDALGNLRGVTLPNGTVITYMLDGQGRRIGKKVNGALVQGFLWQDSLKPIAELDGNGQVVGRFLYATGVNVPDYMIKGGVTYRIITDHLGSPRLTINTADGRIIQRMDYDEFGRVLSDSNPGFQPFGFAGGLYDPATRLVRFGARDYDAETGRWTEKDPIGFEGGVNLYEYLSGDPISRTDVTGEGALVWINQICGKFSKWWNKSPTVSAVKKAKKSKDYIDKGQNVIEKITGVGDIAERREQAAEAFGRSADPNNPDLEGARNESRKAFFSTVRPAVELTRYIPGTTAPKF